jgi:hypothetical protein
MLHYTTDGTTWMDVATTAAGDVFTGVIPAGMPAGVPISYYFSATDNAGLSADSDVNEFSVFQWDGKTDVLIIDEGTHWNDFDNICDDLGYMYTYWDAAGSDGSFDETIPNAGFGTIIQYAQNTDILVTRDGTDNMFKTFLDIGGNLFSEYQDYFFDNGEDGNPVFAAGDFAYDYFGMGGGGNDVSADTVVAGVAGDPLTDAFSADPFNVGDDLLAYGYWGEFWPDEVVARTDDPNAAIIFTYTASGEGAGIRYNTATFKTVFMGLALAWDRAQIDNFYAFVTNVMDWFGTSADVEESDIALIPEKYDLGQNFPNPFNPTTKIDFSIVKNGKVEINVFNMLGQQVATLADNYYQAGAHSVTWNAAGMANGVYFYNIKAGDFNMTKKMVLMK